MPLDPRSPQLAALNPSGWQVLAMTLFNVTLPQAFGTLGGVDLFAAPRTSWRVCLNGQTDPAENGIYGIAASSTGDLLDLQNTPGDINTALNITVTPGAVYRYDHTSQVVRLVNGGDELTESGYFVAKAGYVSLYASQYFLDVPLTARIIGMRVFFDAEEDGDYAELGTQTGFAARATLEDPIDDSETSVRLELTDGDDGIDAYLAGLTAHSEIAALTDVLFIVLANLDSEDGPVTIDADGRPEMEILSVVSRSPVSVGVHDYTVIRGRRGLSPRAWDDCAAWIIPGASLVSWSHETLSTLLDSSTTGYVRLVAYRADAEDEGPSLPTRPITLPPSYDFAPKIDWDTPSTTDGSGNVTVAFDVTDAEGDLVTVRLERRLVDGSDIEVLLERAGMPMTGTFSYSQSTSFTVGTWMLTLTVTDAAGHTRQVVRHVTRAEDGSTILPPQFVPGAPMFGAYTFYVNAPNAPYVEMGWSWIGVSTPTYSQGGHASGIQWGAYGGRRIWSRAYDIIAGVPTYSEWVFIDV